MEIPRETATTNKPPAMRLEVIYWGVDKLLPYARRLRKHDHAVERMMASIREFGFKIPVLIRGTGEVMDGHLRLKAALRLGLTEVPVLLCDEGAGGRRDGVHAPQMPALLLRLSGGRGIRTAPFAGLRQA